MRGRKVPGNGKPVSDHFGYRDSSEPCHFPGVRCDRYWNRRIPARQFGRMSGERVDAVGIQDQGNVQGRYQFPNQPKRLWVVSDTRSQGHDGFALDQRFAKDGFAVRRQGSFGCFRQGRGHDFRHVACHDRQDAGRDRRGHESRAGLNRGPRGHRHGPALAFGTSNDQNRAVVALVGIVVARKDRVGESSPDRATRSHPRLYPPVRRGCRCRRQRLHRPCCMPGEIQGNVSMPRTSP